MDREAFRTVLFRHREALLVLLAVPVVVSALRGGGIERASALLGASVAAAGVLLRLHAVRRIGRGARVFRLHASAGIVDSGPYRWSRNPLYLAASLILCGLALVAGAGVWAWALVPATWIAYTPVVIAEERALAAQVGDAYRRYAECVPRWIGIARHQADEATHAPVAWRAVFRREKGLVPWILVAVLGILAVRSEWVPLPELARRVEVALRTDLAVLVAGAAILAVAVNAGKVEHHQRRQRARDLARGGQAAS